MERPNGVTTNYRYNPVGWLEDITHSSGTTTLANYQYSYDSVGNRTQATETLQSGFTAPTVTVTIIESNGMPMAGRAVYAFDGTTYTGYSKVTDANGQVSITLPAGAYRFRVDVDGTQFWSGETNHCTIGQCDSVMMTVPQAVLVTVQDSDQMPKEGLKVYAFNDSVYTNYNGTTNADGQVSLRLPEGSYRFRADLNGTQFWSANTNHCAVPQCTLVSMSVTLPVTVHVKDDQDAPMSDIKVYAFDDTTYTNFSATTNANGDATFTLPEGNYRFRADFNGTQFWSGAINHCEVPGCTSADVTVTSGVLVTVGDTNGTVKSGIKVYAFNDTTYTNFSATTNADGEATFTLPEGNYRFRADFNGTQFWSGAINHCEVPGCTSAAVTVTNGVSVTVQDTDGAVKPGIKVYAFNGSTYTNYSGTTDANGQVTLTLPQGDYRFRADLNGTQFWSDTQNHCSVPACGSATVTVTKPLTLIVQDVDGVTKSGVKTYAFNGTTYTNFSGTTDVDGQVTFTLPQGNYRFRVDYNDAQYWSGSVNHCALPGCTEVTVIVGPQQPTATITNIPTVVTTATQAATVVSTPNLTVTNTPVPTETPPATLTPDAGVSDTPASTPTEQTFLQSEIALVSFELPGKVQNALVQQSAGVTVTVQDTDGAAQLGIKVYAFDGVTYKNINGTTDTNGQVVLDLPDGSYRFRADLNGTQFWSADVNTCDVPTCTGATVTVTKPLTVVVQDTDGAAQSGIKVYAFDGTTYKNYSGTTDASGQVNLTLPQGSYRFRADLNGTQFWSADVNTCDIPTCAGATVTVTKPLMVVVQDTNGSAQSGIKVYAFDGTTYKNYSGTTDANGQTTLTLPQGSYRFRADLTGTQFWSADINTCDIPTCTSVSIEVTLPVTVSAQTQTGDVYPNLPVYVFNETIYTGYHGTTDANGQVTFTLPQGNYHFRADYDGVQFWSSSENDCGIPGCLAAAITIPGGSEYGEVTIDYVYDPLYRLTEANYSTGDYYHYTYDSVGNRLTYNSLVGDISSTTVYTYRDNNIVDTADNIHYGHDSNGNITYDGAFSYSYDAANRLTIQAQLSGQHTVTFYSYNGLGDRLQETSYLSSGPITTTFTMDYNMGLTQALSDGTNTYIYGNGRIAQTGRSTATDYFSPMPSAQCANSQTGPEPSPTPARTTPTA